MLIRGIIICSGVFIGLYREKQNNWESGGGKVSEYCYFLLLKHAGHFRAFLEGISDYFREFL